MGILHFASKAVDTFQGVPKFHFGTPLSVNRKMKDAEK
jgi:hypothetical protein